MRLRLISLLAATVALGSIQNASAQEQPLKAPPRKAPVYKAPVYKAPRPVVESPTGFYVGGHIGGGWTYNSFTDPTGLFATSMASTRASSLLGGVQAGYNWQFSTTVLGIQGDFSFTDLDASTTAPGFPTTTVSNNTRWISTLTGRAGYAWDKSLWYVKGGAAWVRNHYAMSSAAPPFNFTNETTRAGYVIGGGVEYAFAPDWSAFVEYNYIELTGKNINLADVTTGAVTPLDIYQNMHLLKVGLNYKLSTPRMW